MSVGFSKTKADIDAQAGSLVTAVRDSLRRAAAFKAVLDNTNVITDAYLLTLNYSQAEINLLRAAFSDLNSLYNVAHANGTVSSNNNFFFSADQLTGVI